MGDKMNQLVTVKRVGKTYLAMSRYSPVLQHRAATKLQAIAGIQRLLKARGNKLKPAVIYLQHSKPPGHNPRTVPVAMTVRNPMAHAGIFTGQAAVVMQEICDEAYRLRKVKDLTEAVE